MKRVYQTSGIDETGREYFTFYRSYYDSISNLPEGKRLPLYEAIAAYSLDFTEPDFTDCEDPGTLKAIWAGLLPNMKRNNTRYLNAKNGGAPEGNHNNPNGRRGKKPTNNQPTTNQISNKKEDILNKKTEGNKESPDKAGPESLEYPFTSQEFINAWKELLKLPKWRNKPLTSLQMSLKKLSSYPEGFAIEMIEAAIAGNWQGIVNPSTAVAFKQWQQAHNQPQEGSGEYDEFHFSSTEL